MSALQNHEDTLRERVKDELSRFPGTTIYSRAYHRTPTLRVNFEGHDARTIHEFLGERGVNVTLGSFYAIKATRWLGLGDEGGPRIGLAPYTDDSDVDKLLAALSAYFHR